MCFRVNNSLTKGSSLKSIILFTLPIILGNLIQIFYGFTDAAIAGHVLGPDALAAVGATGSSQWLVISFSFGICEGLCLMVSQKFGAKDEKGLRDSLAIGIIVIAVTSVVFTVLSVLGIDWLIHTINIPQNIYADSRAYLLTVFAGLAVLIFHNYISSVLRAIGDSKICLIFLVASCAVNVVLDFMFVLWLRMGVAGAGIATLLSRLLLCIISLIYMFKKYPMLRIKKENWHIDIPYLIKHIKYGMPTALLQTSTGIANIISSVFINTLGSIALAAIACAQNVEQLVGTSVMSVGSALTTFVAQNYGAGYYHRIKEGIRKTIVFMSVSVGVVSLVLLFACPFFCSLLCGYGKL